MTSSRVFSKIALIALVAGLPASMAIAQDAKLPPVPAAPAVAPPAAPTTTTALKFPSEKFDFGDISDTEPVSHEIAFTNTSNETIKLAVAASCGCTTSTLEKNTFAPGESGKVTASFNPAGRMGPQTKTLTFTVIEPQGKFSQQVVTLTSNVKALVMLDPPKMYLNEVDHRKGQTARLTISGRKAGFEVSKVEATGAGAEFVKTKVLPAEASEVNGEKLVRVPVEIEIGKGAPIGNLAASLVISTNDDKAKLQPYFLGADVIGDVKATPPQAILRVQTPATKFDTQIRLDSRSGSAFAISSIDVEGPKDMNIVTDIAKNDEGRSYLVTVSGVTPNRAGMVQGFLIVTSEAQGGNETMRIPFTAVVNVPQPAPVPAQAVPAPAAPTAPKK